MLFPIAVLSQYIFGSLLFLLSFFIIAIILLQRGRGGGLTGAFGGAGGQSAFGVKAGDLFTRITAILVLLWIFTCAAAARFYREKGLDIQADASASSLSGTGSSAAPAGGLGGSSDVNGLGNAPGLGAPVGLQPPEANPIVPSTPNIPPAAEPTPAPAAEPAPAPAAEPAPAPAAEPAPAPAAEPAPGSDKPQ